MKKDRDEEIKSKYKTEGKNEKEEAKCKEENKDKQAEEGKMESSVRGVNNSKETVVDLESVLREFKIFGRYHLKLIFLLGMLAFGSMWHSTNYIFAVENYGYR